MSHRLVRLGFSEKKTVIILYMISAVCALAVLFFNKINPVAFAAVAFLFCVALFYFCVYLGYSGTGPVARSTGAGRQVKALQVNLQRFIQIFIDLALIAASYYLAYLIRFESGLPGLQVSYFMKTLPVVIAVKIVLFYYFGLYQTIWRHVSVRDFVNILKAVCMSSLVIVAVILMYARFEFFSRTVFVIDAMLCLLLVSGAHFSLRILREYLESQPRVERRVLLIGAGDAGEMALREIRNNPGLKFHVAGFLDDDPFKQKRRIHDVAVMGTITDIGAISEKTGVREALITIPSLSGEGLERIVSLCDRHGIACRRFNGVGREG
jgi:UDP-GlcNAc:undecaprenyl-phosphate GlcNAc-1-phosphate transferase